VAVLLASAPEALATTWTVDDPSGAATSGSSNGTCDAPGGGVNCTIAEAVLESSDLGDTDTIHFNLPAATTIALAGPEGLTLEQPVTIDGCSGAPATSPCVGINGSAVVDSIQVHGNSTTIRGLAITNSNPEAIFAPGGVNGLTVRNSWFGLTIGGAPAGNGAGIDLRGANGTIGGTAPGDRNVFANNAGGIRLFGADNTQVIGNYFGVAPDGVTAAPNTPSDAILIDATPGMDPATGNVIGGNSTAEENLISNSTGATAVGIHINGLIQTGNTVLRNRGTGNLNRFVDLTNGSNNGIQAPTIQASAGLLFGTASAGATVRVYQGNGNAGDLIGFIGAAVADGSGAWSLPCPSGGCPNEPSTGTLVTANQTYLAGNGSELSGQVAYDH
jgi:hypothetical protein